MEICSLPAVRFRLLDNEGIARVAFRTRALFRLADPRFNAKTDQETGHLTKTVLWCASRTAKGDIIGGGKALTSSTVLSQNFRPSVIPGVRCVRQ